MSVRAYVLITTRNKEEKTTVEQLKTLDCVRAIDFVTGPYDVIAIVEVADMDQLGQLITQKIQGIASVERTLTCISFSL